MEVFNVNMVVEQEEVKEDEDEAAESDDEEEDETEEEEEVRTKNTQRSRLNIIIDGDENTWFFSYLFLA